MELGNGKLLSEEWKAHSKKVAEQGRQTPVWSKRSGQKCSGRRIRIFTVTFDASSRRLNISRKMVDRCKVGFDGITS